MTSVWGDNVLGEFTSATTDSRDPTWTITNHWKVVEVEPTDYGYRHLGREFRLVKISNDRSLIHEQLTRGEIKGLRDMFNKVLGES